MTTRNQRRNRKLAIARERVRELEVEVARLRAEFAEANQPAPLYLAAADRARAQEAYNRAMSDVIGRIAMVRR